MEQKFSGIPEELGGKLKKSIAEQINTVGENFKKHVSHEKDDEVVVLKSHLLVEYYLNHILVVFLPNGHKLAKELTFAEKVEAIAKDPNASEDIDPEIFPSIKALNRVRNEMSHELSFQLTEAQVDLIGFPLGERYVIKKIKDNLPTPKARFIVLMIEIIMGVYNPIAMKVAMDIYRKDSKKD